MTTYTQLMNRGLVPRQPESFEQDNDLAAQDNGSSPVTIITGGNNILGGHPKSPLFGDAHGAIAKAILYRNLQNYFVTPSTPLEVRVEKENDSQQQYASRMGMR